VVSEKTDMRDYFTLEEMAFLMQLDPKTLKNRVGASREHPPVFKPGAGIYQFPKKDYYAWRDRKVQKASA